MKQEKGIIPIIILIVVVVLVAGAYYLGGKNVFKSIVNVGSPVPTSTSDPTASWKTYTSSFEKVSFKYPSDWVLIDKGEGPTYITDQNKEITLMTTGGAKNKTIKEDLHFYLEKQTSYGDQGLQYISEKAVTVDGSEGWYAHVKINSLNQEDVIVFINHKTLLDRYSGLWLNKYTDAYAEVFDQILSTFKFTQ